MTTQFKSNAVYAGSASLGEIATLTKSAQDVYDAYAARVALDAGTIQNSAATLAAITAAIAGGYFYKSAWAISPRWGIKVSGSNITKFYNLVDSSKDAIVTGLLPLDTTHETWATARFDSTQAVTFTGVNLNKTGVYGMLTATGDHSGAANGLFALCTPVAQLWNWSDAAYRLIVNGVTKIASSPDFGSTDNDAVGVLVEQVTGRFSLLINGIERKVATTTLTALATNQTGTLTIQRDTGTVYMAEHWYMNAATPATFASASFDLGGRY